MFRAIIWPILRNNSLCSHRWYNAPTMLPAGYKDEVEIHYLPIFRKAHYKCLQAYRNTAINPYRTNVEKRVSS